jgi:acetoin utilization deacetylase AcuC-like enzyme
MLLYHHPDFTKHKTGHGHPESPQRYLAIEGHQPFQELIAKCRKPTFSPLTEKQLSAVHSPEVAAYIRAACERGGGRIEADTVVSKESFDIGLLAAGECCAAVEAVIKGEDKTALCLVRPPGHHATPKQSMGFCLFNNVALAARHAQTHGAERVLIVDWDVHHGNGTQDAFYTDPNIFYLSLHRFPFYPGTGLVSETGTARGLGTTLNVPLAFGIGRADYRHAFKNALDKATQHFKPDIILISAGFDAHAEDPIGSLGLATEDFATLTETIKHVANTHAQGRVVSCLEGGYNLERLAESLTVHAQALMKQ